MTQIARDSRDQRRTRREIVEEAVKPMSNRDGTFTVVHGVRIETGHSTQQTVKDIRRGLEQLLDELDG